MAADARVETVREETAFDAALGAQMRMLTDADLQRLIVLLASAREDTQLTWTAKAPQSASEVPDEVLAAIPLVRLVEVSDYWDAVHAVSDEWRGGVVALFRSVAEAQRGPGATASNWAEQSAEWGFAETWRGLNLRWRLTYVAAFVLLEAALVALGFVSGWAYFVGFALGLYASWGPLPAPRSLSSHPSPQRRLSIRELRAASPRDRRRALVALGLFVALLAALVVAFVESLAHPAALTTLAPFDGAAVLALFVLASFARSLWTKPND